MQIKLNCLVNLIKQFQLRSVSKIVLAHSMEYFYYKLKDWIGPLAVAAVSYYPPNYAPNQQGFFEQNSIY